MKGIDYLGVKERIGRIGQSVRQLEDDFYIYEITRCPSLGYPFKISEYSCYVCLEGESRVTIDLAPFALRASALAVNVPGQLLEQQATSDDFRAVGITMSPAFVKELGFPYNFQLDRMLRDAPILELQPSQLESILSYGTMVRRLLDTKRPFQRETLRHLTCAFFYGIGARLYQMAEKRVCSNDEVLMNRFLTEVRMHYRKQRKVLFYADRLHLSPSYLSTVVRHVSGKVPTEWIDEHVVAEARALLKGTNLTVQQISHELGFPSQSFFGKFFKRMTGLSPKAYREGRS